MSNIEELEKELELIDTQIAELKAKRKEIKSKIPRKPISIKYTEFEAQVVDISFGSEYKLQPLNDVENFSPQRYAILIHKETKWNAKNTPKIGDIVLARIRYLKQGFQRVGIIKIINDI